MSRPTLEVADIVRAVGNRFWEKNKQHFAWVHRKVLDVIVRCRTAALGGHRDKCVRCGHLTASYNSCRNRHCPKCQGNVRNGSRRARLLGNSGVQDGNWHLRPAFAVGFTGVPIWQNSLGCNDRSRGVDLPTCSYFGVAVGSWPTLPYAESPPPKSVRITDKTSRAGLAARKR